MDYTIDYLTDKKIVSVKMTGRLNFQIAEQYSTEAVKLARQNNCTKFLIDHTGTTVRGRIDKIYAAGEELQQFGFINTDHIAIIIADLGSNPDLLENVNQNSRWSIVKYFNADNLQAAFDWLLEIEQLEINRKYQF